MKLESLRIFNLRITFAAKPTLTVAITTTMAKRIAQYSKKEKKKKQFNSLIVIDSNHK